MLAEAPELVNVKVNKISPLLNASVRSKDLDKVKALVEAGADVNNNDLGTHWPSRDYEINRYLISPSLKTVSRMQHPKQFTEWTDEVTALVWPLREFKRVVFQPYEGETPLDMALREGNEEIVNTLLR